jgi:predicted nucleotide-binding protein
MTKWTVASARELLQNNGLKIASEERLQNDLGFCLRCAEGEIVNVFDSGKLSVQGKNQNKVKELFGKTSPSGASVTTADALNHYAGNRDIFVVYGHDTKARTELEAMLRRWGLNP